MACPLLTIPREIRDKIYQYLFNDDHDILFAKPNTGPDRTVERPPMSDYPPIFSTCRQLFAEASDVFYSKGCFGIWLRNDHWFDPMLKNIGKIKDLHILCELGDPALNGPTVEDFYDALNGIWARTCRLDKLTLVFTPYTAAECVREDIVITPLARIRVVNQLVICKDGVSWDSERIYKLLAREIAYDRQWIMEDVDAHAWVLQPRGTTFSPSELRDESRFLFKEDFRGIYIAKRMPWDQWD